MRLHFFFALVLACSVMSACGNKPTQLQLPESDSEQTTQSVPAEG